jgi:hypothetical protein
MSRQIRIYGHSDDLMELEGTRPKEGEPDEFGIGKDNRAAVLISSPTEGAMKVVADYSHRGDKGAAWLIGIELVDEDVLLPDWPMSWSTHSRGYSPLLTIELPDDAVVTQAWPDAGEGEA